MKDKFEKLVQCRDWIEIEKLTYSDGYEVNVVIEVKRKRKGLRELCSLVWRERGHVG